MLLLANLLKGFEQRGWLDLFDAHGNRHRYGSGGDAVPIVRGYMLEAERPALTLAV